MIFLHQIMPISSTNNRGDQYDFGPRKPDQSPIYVTSPPDQLHQRGTLPVLEQPGGQTSRLVCELSGRLRAGRTLAVPSGALSLQNEVNCLKRGGTILQLDHEIGSQSSVDIALELAVGIAQLPRCAEVCAPDEGERLVCAEG